MIRTQVYFPEDLHKDLKAAALTEGVSFAELVREGGEKVVKEKKLKARGKRVKFDLPVFKGGKKLPRVIDRKFIYEGIEKRAVGH